MCKIGFLSFGPKVSQEARKVALGQMLYNSVEMGNRDGAGYVVWGATGPVTVARSLDFKALKVPESVATFALVHARTATNAKVIENTHPFVADDAYLVHNGIVHPQYAAEKELQASCKSTCDSELILAAYLQSGRDLKAALGKIYGSANVLIWDAKRKVLSVFADGTPFEIWRQGGVFTIAQSQRQTTGLISSGLGHPYEFEELQANKVYEFSLAEDSVDWTAAVPAVVKKARAFTLPNYSTTPWPGKRTTYDGWKGRWDPIERRWIPEDNPEPTIVSKKEQKKLNKEARTVYQRAMVYLTAAEAEKRARLIDTLRNMTKEERQTAFAKLTADEKELLSAIHHHGS